jgi:hypothetical protein
MSRKLCDFLRSTIKKQDIFTTYFTVKYELDPLVYRQNSQGSWIVFSPQVSTIYLIACMTVGLGAEIHPLSVKIGSSCTVCASKRPKGHKKCGFQRLLNNTEGKAICRLHKRPHADLNSSC